MFAYEFDQLNALLKEILQTNLSADAWKWLENEGNSIRERNDVAKFNIAFVAMPRKSGKEVVRISDEQVSRLQSALPGFNVSGWTSDRLARVWLLLQVDPRAKGKYFATIENLFLNAEMGELVALYSALPVLAYPEAWRKRCAEGIRNNIGQVLDAVICNNPYPAAQLDEAAWNQLVLKAIFTEKPVLQIVGLRERRNRNLAESLSDYAHERWAAHREVNPLLWVCVAPFVDERIFEDVRRLFSEGNAMEREAAALVCDETAFEPAKGLLADYPDMRNAIRSGAIAWEQIAEQMAVRV